jgi:hypothetical protein
MPKTLANKIIGQILTIARSELAYEVLTSSNNFLEQ